MPGSGAKDQGEWPEVYRETLAAGKRAQIFGHSDGFGSKQDFHWFERVLDDTGNASLDKTTGKTEHCLTAKPRGECRCDDHHQRQRAPG